MFGDESDERTDGDRAAPDAHELAREAEGASVTADRLVGAEEYFPDCRPFLQEGQQPHHLILLTTSGWAFRAEGLSTSADYTYTDLNASEGGVVICTETELLAVVDDSFCEVPFTSLQGILRSGDAIELHAYGDKSYVLDVAASADDGEVDAAVDYLRRRLRSAASEKHTSRRS